MIDIFNEIYTAIKGVLPANVKMSSVYTNSPSEYPFVSVEEINNSTYRPTIDGLKNENYAEIDFEFNIITKGEQKKSLGTDLLVLIDTKMNDLGFVRVTKNNFQNTNETIYRIIVRYTAIVSQDKKIYRR